MFYFNIRTKKECKVMIYRGTCRDRRDTLKRRQEPKAWIPTGVYPREYEGGNDEKKVLLFRPCSHPSH
jgi:hypothetical protein